MLCKKCGNELLSDSDFCSGCGTKVEKGNTFCRKCGNVIEENAEFCYKCGTATKGRNKKQTTKKPVYKKWWFWVIIAFAALIIIGNTEESETDSGDGGQSSVSTTADQPEETTEAPEEIIEISAQDLFAAYDQNEIAADAKYKGKKLKITGTVNNIGRDILDDVYITMDTGEYLWDVQCYFTDAEQIDAVASLKSGDTITIIGECSGLSITSVVVKNCEIQ